MDIDALMRVFTDLFGYGFVTLLSLTVLPRRFRIGTTIALWLPCFLIVECIQFYAERFTLLKMVGTPALLILFGVLTTKDRLWKRIFVSAMGFVAMIASELIVLPFCANSDVLRYGPTALPFKMQMLMRVVSVAVMGAVTWLFYRLLRQRDANEPLKTRLTLLLFPIVQIIICIMVLYFSADDFSKTGEVSNIFYAYAILMIGWVFLFLLGIYQRNKRQEQEIISATLAQCIGGQQGYYDELTAQYELNRQMRHDIEKHFRAIRAMLDSGDTDDCAAYVSKLEAERVQSREPLCENPVVDAYLHSVITEAKELGVVIRPSVCVPAHLPIQHAELVCIFGNLLDNAIEAAVGAEEPFVELNSFVQSGCLVIRARNPVSAEKKNQGGTAHYGIGQKILRELAAKYNGTVSFQNENGIYTANAVFTI